MTHTNGLISIYRLMLARRCPLTIVHVIENWRPQGGGGGGSWVTSEHGGHTKRAMVGWREESDQVGYPSAGHGRLEGGIRPSRLSIRGPRSAGGRHPTESDIHPRPNRHTKVGPLVPRFAKPQSGRPLLQTSGRWRWFFRPESAPKDSCQQGCFHFVSL